MRRVWILLLLLATHGVADEKAQSVVEPKAKPKAKAKEPAPKRYVLLYGMTEGARYIGSNSVAFTLRKGVRSGPKKEVVTHESVERTERFRDTVKRYSGRGMLEIEREYQRLFTKVRASDRARPDVEQSPLQGAKVTITEKRRRRSIRAGKGVSVPGFVRKTVGMEIDWRDILPRESVAVGDIWDADCESVARRMAPYLDSGSRSRMKVRFEGVDVVEGRRIARLYVDWEINGMRDKQLYTKAVLAGDLRFDLEMQRFVLIDVAGSFSVTGAIIGEGKIKIIQAKGKVSLKSTLREELIAAAAPVEEPNRAK